ncbi:MAG: hypothetical protein NTV54_13780 [Ignavibacteriales bacterium]|nr:hypothetical protein [Ignavibacteriales bacterium]
MKELEEDIRALRSKVQVHKIIRWIGRDPVRFRELMQLLLKGDVRIAQLSSWIVGHIGETAPELVRPYLKDLIRKMSEKGIHPAVRRNTLRALQFADIPRGLQGRLATLCFDYLSSMDEPIAVRALSMTILTQLAKKEPDLRRELEVIVRQLLPYGTAAFYSCAKKILKNLPPYEMRESSL